jgi:chromosome segregation ATPase
MIKELDDLNKQIADVRIQLDSYADTNNKLKLEIEQNNKSCQNLIEQKSQLIDENSVLSDNLGEREAEIKSADMIHDALLKESKDLETKISGLNNEINNFQEDIKSLSGEKHDLEEEKEQLKKDLNEQNVEINQNILKEIDNSKSILNDYDVKLINGRLELESLSSRLEGVNQAVFSSNDVLTNAKNELNSVNNEIDKKNKILLDFVAHIDAERNRVDQIMIEYKINTDNLNSLLSKVSDAQVNLDKVLLAAGRVLDKEEYLKNQEASIKEKFERLGIAYQPFA